MNRGKKMKCLSEISEKCLKEFITTPETRICYLCTNYINGMQSEIEGRKNKSRISRDNFGVFEIKESK